MSTAAAPASLAGRVQMELSRLSGILLEEFTGDHWEGYLSSSALSTAVATIALGQMDLHERTERHAAPIQAGLRWLADNANEDGGWGDTICSKSNISTTALCRAAFAAARADEQHECAVRPAERWLTREAGSLEDLPDVIARRYGRDRTFSIPILMSLAIGGCLGENGWRKVQALPFELAVVPRQLYGALRLPVVSYALPALIAIGQAIHHHAPSRNPVARATRILCRGRTLRILTGLQPENGGFLEATPLTAFVTMSLASAGQAKHIVAQKASAFLRASMRPDGSWPIDTNLATWVTTLSVKALSSQPDALSEIQKDHIRKWLLRQQTRTIHPYTGAAAGAWAWTDLPGGVPDADDTAGALLALHVLGGPDRETVSAAESGINWLIDLQNRDGGIPTFCRGWGALPFDRSTPEITAHALRAWIKWRPLIAAELSARLDRATQRAMRYLQRSQNPDGSWLPLWFGNEHAREEANPVYGTAQVLISLNEIEEGGFGVAAELRSRAAEFLKSCQQLDGGWGGDNLAPASIEETSLAVEALAPVRQYFSIVQSGVQRLLEMVEANRWREPAPIGLYFARLWYFERLYPLIFAAGALSRVHSDLSKQS